jgi:hypothetical protein
VALGSVVATALGWAWILRQGRGRRSAGPPASRGFWLLTLGLPGLAFALFVPAGEYLIEGADGSAYIAIGRNLARTGALVSPDPLLAIFPDGLRRFLVWSGMPDVLDRFPGGFRLSAGSDTVQPDFFHLLPVWVAIAESALGSFAAYWVNVTFGALSVLLVWLIGCRVWSQAAGATAAVLMAANFAQVWYTRLPSSEILGQFFLLSGVLFTLQAWDRRDPVAGAAAGIAVGMAAFVRIDALVFVPLAFVWVAWARYHGGRAPVWTWYAACLAVISAHAAGHALTLSRLYTLRIATSGWARASQIVESVGAGLFVLVALGVVVVFLAVRRVIGRPALLAASACGLGGMAAVAPGVAWVVGRLLTPAGLIAGLAGLSVLLLRQDPIRSAPLLVPFAVHAGLLFVWGEVVELPDDFRRAVTVLLPATMLGVGILVATISTWRNWLGRLIWLLPVGMFLALAADTWPVLRSPAMRGVHRQVAALAASLPSDAVVLTDWSVPGHLALALQYTFDRPAARLPPRVASAGEVEELFDSLLASRRPVVLAVNASAGDGTLRVDRRDLAGFALDRIGVWPLHLVRLEPAVGSFPREVRPRDVAVHLYRVDRAGRGVPAVLPLVLDVGGDDFPYILGGFHGAEAMPSGSARWTTGQARLLIPRLVLGVGQPATLALRVTAGRRPGLGRVEARVSIEDVLAGIIAVSGPGFETHQLSLPSELQTRLAQAPTALTIETDTFVPKDAGLGADDRVLGIAVDWILLK